MDIQKIMAESGIVPVVVLEDAKDAVPTAKALLAGGIRVMEITFRTAAAEASIKAVAESCPDIIVGAGTIITLEQCKTAIAAGAKFIVAPGFDSEVVDHCIACNVPITPGCVTPTEITMAMKKGLRLLKYFPANVYGGLKGLKSLSAPFGSVKFIPTGGVSNDNVSDFAAAPFVQAVGGSWICPKADISAGNFEKITKLCREARKALLGYEVAHIGVNCDDAQASAEVCEALNKAFGFEVKSGSSSNFAGTDVEVMKSRYLGCHGHIAVRTSSIPCALADLAERGFEADMETAKYKGERMIAVYLKNEIGGFAIHLLQK